MLDVAKSRGFSTHAAHSHPRFRVTLASSASDIESAQRLRYLVFAEEMGAQLNVGRSGIDSDRFDRYCEHLIVQDEITREVVGTYRILSPTKARLSGGYYAESEFDLARFAAFRESLVEVGRSCVHPDYRTGTVIALLWAGLMDYMRHGGYGYLMGCASIPMSDGGHSAVGCFEYLKTRHMCPPEWQVTPRIRLPLEAITPTRAIKIPPLIKGYLRAGACICGEPAWDANFNSADLLILLPMSRIESRYFRHFVKRS